MPVAEPFAFYGAYETTSNNGFGGTGLPLDIEKVDVSGFDFWTTLGGFVKGSTGKPTVAQQGLKQACNLYWNLNSINADCEVTGSNTIDTAFAKVSSLTVGFNGNPEPKNRATGSFSEDRINDQQTIGSDPFWTASSQLDFGVETIARFYDGPTSDENNFVGYGLLPFFSEPSVPDFDRNETFLNFTASAVFTDESDAIGNSASRYYCLGSYVENGNPAWVYGYQTVSGITFVSAVYIFFQGGSPEATVKSQITGLDFYTYA
jgi:hypothetical protein